MHYGRVPPTSQYPVLIFKVQVHSYMPRSGNKDKASGVAALPKTIVTKHFKASYMLPDSWLGYQKAAILEEPKPYEFEEREER